MRSPCRRPFSCPSRCSRCRPVPVENGFPRALGLISPPSAFVLRLWGRALQPAGSAPPACILSMSCCACASSTVAPSAANSVESITLFIAVSSPVELYPKLDLARRARGDKLAERVVRRVARRQARRAGVVEAVRARVREPLRVVERVDRVGAELDALRAVDRPVLGERQVGLIPSRLAEFGSHPVAERA